MSVPNEVAECRDCDWLAVGDGLGAAMRHVESLLRPVRTVDAS